MLEPQQRDRSATIIINTGFLPTLMANGLRGLVRAIVVGVVGALCCIALAAIDFGDAIVPRLVLMAPPLACVGGVLGFLFRWLQLRSARRSIVFDEGKIIERIDDHSITHPWSWLTRLRQDEELVFIDVGRGRTKRTLSLDKRTEAACRILELDAERRRPPPKRATKPDYDVN